MEIFTPHLPIEMLKPEVFCNEEASATCMFTAKFTCQPKSPRMAGEIPGINRLSNKRLDSQKQKYASFVNLCQAMRLSTGPTAKSRERSSVGMLGLLCEVAGTHPVSFNSSHPLLVEDLHYSANTS